MKLGDLVKYDTTRYDDYQNEPGLVIKLYYEEQIALGLVTDREMADVLFPYGVVGDDTYEFEVISEAR